MNLALPTGYDFEDRNWILSCDCQVIKQLPLLCISPFHCHADQSLAGDGEYIVTRSINSLITQCKFDRVMVLLSSLLVFILQLSAAGVLRMLREDLGNLSSVRNKHIFKMNRTAILLKIGFASTLLKLLVIFYLTLFLYLQIIFHFIVQKLCSNYHLHIFLQNRALSSTIHFCIINFLLGLL